MLLHWSRDDAFTERDLLNGGVAAFGGTGSGKTSSSGKAIGNAVVAAMNSGGLILAAKPEDVGMWRDLFARHGRRKDLVVFGALEDRWRFNLLQHVGRYGGSTRDITAAIRTIGQSLQSGGDKSHGENGDFFESQENCLLECAVEVVKLGTGRVTAPDLHRFITTSASTSTELESAQWQADFHNQCMKAAFQRKKTPIESHDFELAAGYFVRELPAMVDKTRSSIMAGVLSVLHVFNSGMVRELVSTTTTVTPDDLFNRKWVLVNLPPAKWGDTGTFVCAAWKHQAQQATGVTPGRTILFM